MKIPIPYNLILKKLQLHTDKNNIIGVRAAKYYVSVCFRVNHKIIGKMFIEMKDLGLINFVNHTEIKVLGNPL